MYQMRMIFQPEIWRYTQLYTMPARHTIAPTWEWPVQGKWPRISTKGLQPSAVASLCCSCRSSRSTCGCSRRYSPDCNILQNAGQDCLRFWRSTWSPPRRLVPNPGCSPSRGPWPWWRPWGRRRSCSCWWARRRTRLAGPGRTRCTPCTAGRL